MFSNERGMNSENGGRGRVRKWVFGVYGLSHFFDLFTFLPLSSLHYSLRIGASTTS